MFTWRSIQSGENQGLLAAKTLEICGNEILPWEYLARTAYVKTGWRHIKHMVLECIFRVFQGSFHVIGTTAAFTKMHQITKFEECNCERIFFMLQCLNHLLLFTHQLLPQHDFTNCFVRPKKKRVLKNVHCNILFFNIICSYKLNVLVLCWVDVNTVIICRSLIWFWEQTQPQRVWS